MATSTATVVETRQQPPKMTTSSDELDQINELPRPVLQRSTTIHNPSPGFSHRHRHSKKLSLNFPIVVPVPITYDQSAPMTANGSMSSISHSPSIASPYRNGTPTTSTHMHTPMQVPNETGEDGPDFLTLIASQERRVMELKEELMKAETGLLELKRQWGKFESKKKAAEMRARPTRPGSAHVKSTEAASLEDEEVERMKRREAREKERKMRDLALKEAAAAGIEKLGSNASGGKGKGGRVFAGRHTRTLSLLQSTNANSNVNPEGDAQQKPRSESSPVTSVTPTGRDTDDNTKKQQRKSLSRQPTLQELIATSATGAAQLNFGKTYKDLAQAGRKSLPPGTDDLVKQGKQVYDGINQGFWNFVEDIRQATVGDEAVNGPPPTEQRREVKQKRSNKKLAGENAGKSASRAESKKGKPADDLKNEKDNFWKEFGIETPKGAKNKAQPMKRSKENQAPLIDHESKSSTDSKCPPSLLDDMEDDEAWDSWPTESPQAQRRTEPSVNIRNISEDDSEEEITAEARKAFNRRLQAKRPAGSQAASWADLMS